jgi:uncharacterized SAM-binding protein YcdF (DUF218 family)
MTKTAVWRRAAGWIRRAILALLVCLGAATLITCACLIAGTSLGVERALDVTSRPTRADAIVCIGGGTTGHDLPTADGWQRIATAAALFADGYAPMVVFTGRGNARVSEAEIYAEAGQWLGVPAPAVALDPLPASTAEHPDALLKSLGGRLTRDSRLLLVTSSLHSRRVLMTFRRHGFTNVAVVSGYSAGRRLGGQARREQSSLPAFRPDSKQYGDPLFNLAQNSSALFIALREWAAIVVYRVRGQA